MAQFKNGGPVALGTNCFLGRGSCCAISPDAWLLSADEPDVRRVGDLTLDMNQRVLQRNGDHVHLTLTEFHLLALLMRNEGVPVPHAKLLRSIWGPEYSSELEYLRSYIKALRKKIELDPSQPKYILTEPWFGYRMCNPNVAVYGAHLD